MKYALLAGLVLAATPARAHEIDPRAWNQCVLEVQGYGFDSPGMMRMAFDACYSHKYALLHHLPWGAGTLPER